MSDKLQSVRGMNDLLPSQTPYWQAVEGTLREIAMAYGYQEIRTPILEKTALFVQSIGEQTDIVEKEMFAFKDAGDEHVCMRPESTASVVRAGVQHGLFHNTQTRLWYLGPMFRRERPQKGRYRQFMQFGMEAFGWASAEADVEIILAGERVWKKLGVRDVKLVLNTLGSDQCRIKYRAALVAYLEDFTDQLDTDSLRRLADNPLRILDSKNQKTQAILKNAPRIDGYLDAPAQAHFDKMCGLLDAQGVDYTIDPGLVRGLDYYTSTVFEWKTTKLGAQDTICAGGRYDNLVDRRGGKSTPACGFAMGLDRVLELLLEEDNAPEINCIDVYFISLDASVSAAAFRLAEDLRGHGLSIAMNHGVGKLKAQLKRADMSGAAYALILGDNELNTETVQIKPLRDQRPAQTLGFDKLVEFFTFDGIVSE